MKLLKSPTKIGLFAGSIAILCCVSPVFLVLLGLSSVTAAIALGNLLFYEYKFYFIGASLIFLIAALYVYFKKEKICTLKGLKKNYNLIIIALFVATLTYIFWYYFTTWLASLAS